MNIDFLPNILLGIQNLFHWFFPLVEASSSDTVLCHTQDTLVRKLKTMEGGGQETPPTQLARAVEYIDCISAER